MVVVVVAVPAEGRGRERVGDRWGWNRGWDRGVCVLLYRGNGRVVCVLRLSSYRRSNIINLVGSLCTEFTLELISPDSWIG